MAYAVGEHVVYPSHGAAVVENIETRRVNGEDRAYLVLRVAHNGMTVHVPACNADLVGVRQVVDEDGLGRVLAVLRAECPQESVTWSRRYKGNVDKLRSGAACQVAEVVRDLWRRDRDRGLSSAEHRMLAEARRILVSELALCENTDETRARTLLEETLAG